MHTITSLAAAAAVCAAAALPAQSVFTKTLDTRIPYLRAVGYGYGAATMTAAPTESIPAPSPNPNNLGDTSQVAYVLWRTNQTAQSAPANSAPHTLHLGRTTDGGKTWTTKVIHTAPGTASGDSYTDPNALIDFHIGAEGNTVFVCFVSAIGGQSSPVNIYLMGSEDQGQTWSPVTLANKTTATQGNTDFWANELRMSVVRDPGSQQVRAHLCYEYGDTVIRHPTSQGTEAPYHTAFEFVNGTLTDVVKEKDISNVPPNQNKDIDNLSMTAQGGNILVMWRSDRNTYSGTAASSFNQLFGTFSTDGGATFAPDFLLGDMRPPLGPPTGTLDPLVNGVTGSSINPASDFGLAIDGPRFYFLWMDRSHNQGPPINVVANERVFLYYSHALGIPGSWNLTEVTSYQAGRADIDTFDIAAEKGRVVIAMSSDERGRHKSITGMAGELTNTPADKAVAADNQGDGNHANQIQVCVSEDGGKNFNRQWVSVNSIDDGSVQATQAWTGTVSGSIATLKGTNFVNCKNLQLEMKNDVCHLCFEEEWYGGYSVHQGEDLVMLLSLDGGKTWGQRLNATGFGAEVRGVAAAQRDNGDIDSPFMAMTAAGTAIVGFRHETSSGSGTDAPQVYSRPAPLSVDVSKISLATGGTQSQLLDAGTAHQNRLYLVAGSLTGSSPGFDLGPVHIALVPDAWTTLSIALANTPALPNTRGSLSANGTATAGLVVPPGLTDPALIGLKIYTAALIHDAQGYYLGTNAGVLEIVR